MTSLHATFCVLRAAYSSIYRILSSDDYVNMYDMDESTTYHGRVGYAEATPVRGRDAGGFLRRDGGE